MVKIKDKIANPLCYYTNLAKALKDTIFRLRACPRQNCPWIVQHNVRLVFIIVYYIDSCELQNFPS